MFPEKKNWFKKNLRKVDSHLDNWEKEVHSKNPWIFWGNRFHHRKADLLHHDQRKEVDDKVMKMKSKLEAMAFNDRLSASDYLKIKKEISEREGKVKGIEKEIQKRKE